MTALEEELAVAFGVDQATAAQCAQEMRMEIDAKDLLAADLGGLQAAIECSALGHLLLKVRKYSSLPDDQLRKKAGIRPCKLPEVKGLQPNLTVEDTLRQLSVALPQLPKDTPLTELAARGIFREDPGAFARFVNFQKLTGTQVFEFRLQSSADKGGVLPEAARHVAAGASAVVVQTHAASKSGMLEVANTLDAQSIAYLVDENHAEKPCECEATSVGWQRRVDFEASVDSAQRLFPPAKQEKLKASFQELMSPDVTQERREELLALTGRAAETMRAAECERLQPDALAAHMLNLQRLGLYAHKPRLSQLHALDHAQNVMRNHPSYQLQLVLPCGLGKGDIIALLVRDLLLRSTRPLLVVVAAPTTQLAEDLASRLLPFVHDIPVHVYGVPGRFLGRDEALARCCDRRCDAASPPRQTQRLEAGAALAARSFFFTATPRLRDANPSHFFSVTVDWKSAVAQRECLPLRMVEMACDFGPICEALNGVAEHMADLGLCHLSFGRARRFAACVNAAPRNLASFVLQYFSTVPFTVSILVQELQKRQPAWVAKYESEQALRKALSLLLHEWHNAGGLTKTDRSGQEHFYAMQGQTDEETGRALLWVLAAQAAAQLVHVRRLPELRKGFCFSRDNSRAAFLSAFTKFLTSEPEGHEALRRVEEAIYQDARPWDLQTECASSQEPKELRALTERMNSTGSDVLQMTFSSVLNSEGTNVRDLGFVSLLGLPFRSTEIFYLQLLSRSNRTDGNKRWGVLLRLTRQVKPKECAEAQTANGKLTRPQLTVRRRQQKSTSCLERAASATLALAQTADPAQEQSTDWSSVTETPPPSDFVVVGQNQKNRNAQPSTEDIGAIHLFKRRLPQVTCQPSSSAPDVLVVDYEWQKVRDRVGLWRRPAQEPTPGRDEDAYWLSLPPLKECKTFDAALDEIRRQLSMGAQGRDACPPAQGPSRASNFRDEYTRFLCNTQGLQETSDNGEPSTVVQYWNALCRSCTRWELGDPVQTTVFLKQLAEASAKEPAEGKTPAVEYAIELLQKLRRRGRLQNPGKREAAPKQAPAKRARREECSEPEWRRLYLNFLERETPKLIKKTREGYADEVKNFWREDCQCEGEPPLEKDPRQHIMQEHAPTHEHRGRPSAVKKYLEFLKLRRDGNTGERAHGNVSQDLSHEQPARKRSRVDHTSAKETYCLADYLNFVKNADNIGKHSKNRYESTLRKLFDGPQTAAELTGVSDCAPLATAFLDSKEATEIQVISANMSALAAALPPCKSVRSQGKDMSQLASLLSNKWVQFVKHMDAKAECVPK